MAGIRRAFLLNSAEKYLCLLISFLSVSIVSRLLSPSEVGLSVIGTGIMTVALSVREFASAEFLIQRRTVSEDDVRSSFTILLLLYAMIAAVLWGAASWVAEFYGNMLLGGFLRVVIVAGMVDTCSMPIIALLRRDLAFGTLAVITVTTAVVSTIATIGLIVMGVGFMSFAWAWLAAAATTAALSLYVRPAWWIFRPALRSWRTVLSFGGYNGAAAILARLYEALPQLMLGGILSASVAGLYNRASVVCGLPDRFVLSGVFSVAFPALAAEVRSGLSPKASYLRALGYISVVYWPAMLLLTVLAHPVVALLLGTEWLSIVPLVQIMGVGCLPWFPAILTAPVLASTGAFRDLFLSKLVSVAVCGVALVAASQYGVRAMAASQFFTAPFQALVSLYFIRRWVSVEVGELLAALWKSVAVTACALAGPLATLGMVGARVELSYGQAVFAGGLAALGWAGGLWLTRHPFRAEVLKLAERAIVRVRPAPAPAHSQQSTD